MGSRVRLCFGECYGGLTFLEEGYARAIGDFKEALASSSSWGELRSKISEEYYEETLERWREEEYSSRMNTEDIEEWQIPDPRPEDPFSAARMHGYLDMEWPEFAPAMMDEWVSKDLIERYGGYVQPTLDDDYPLIDSENEAKVVSLLEAQDYICTRDDAMIWRAIFGE